MPSPFRCAVMLVLVASAGCGRRYDLADPAPAASARAASLAAQPAAPVEAPSTAELGHLTRADCLRLALANNRPYRIRRSGLGRADDGRILAQSQVYAPVASASYTVANHDGENGVGRVGVAVPVYGFTVEPFVDVGFEQESNAGVGVGSYETSSGVVVSRPLFAIATHRAQQLPITAAEKEYLAAANGVVLERKRVELEVVRRFFNLQRALSRERVRTRRVDDARDFLQAVKDNVRLGFKAPVEELQASISLNQAEADLLNAATEVREAQEGLLQFLAQPVASDVAIVEEDIAGVAVPLPPLDADVIHLRADHEELGNQLLDLKLDYERLAIQRDDVWPDLGAAVTAENRRTGDAPFDDSIANEDIIALTLTLAVPLDFARGARARLRQMDAEIAEKRLQIQEAENELEGRLRSTHRRIAQLDAQVGLATRRLEAERGKMEVTLARYRAGTIDNLEVTRAKQDLDNAEIGLADSRINLVIAAAEYRNIMPAPMVPVGAPLPLPALPEGAAPAPAPAAPAPPEANE